MWWWRIKLELLPNMLTVIMWAKQLDKEDGIWFLLITPALCRSKLKFSSSSDQTCVKESWHEGQGLQELSHRASWAVDVIFMMMDWSSQDWLPCAVPLCSRALLSSLPSPPVLSSFSSPSFAPQNALPQGTRPLTRFQHLNIGLPSSDAVRNKQLLFPL